MGSAWRRRRKLAWATALAASAAVHLGLFVFLVGDNGPRSIRSTYRAIDIELSPVLPKTEPRPPPRMAKPSKPRAAFASPAIRDVPNAAPVPEPAPFAAAQPPPSGLPSELPRLSLDNDPCSPARRSALTAVQRERCDRRVRGYTDFKTARPTQFEQQAREGYIKQDLPYLARRPTQGCKPFVAGRGAPDGPRSGDDEKIVSLSCAFRF